MAVGASVAVAARVDSVAVVLMVVALTAVVLVEVLVRGAIISGVETLGTPADLEERAAEQMVLEVQRAEVMDSGVPVVLGMPVVWDEVLLAMGLTATA